MPGEFPIVWFNPLDYGSVPPQTPAPTESGAASSHGASGSWAPSANSGTPLTASQIFDSTGVFNSDKGTGNGGLLDTIESWGTGYSTADLQKQSADLDAQLAALNEEAHTQGTIDDATYQTTVDHLAKQIAATREIPDDINAAYVEGALAGYKNDLAVLEAIPKYAGRVTGDVLGAITSGVGSGLGSILKSIPWWIWLGGALVLFGYLGGGKAVEYQARKRIARYAR